MARLLLRSLGPDWSAMHLAKAQPPLGAAPRDPAYTYQTKPLQLDGITLAVLGAGVLAGIRGYLWLQQGEPAKALLLGAGVLATLVVGGVGLVALATGAPAGV